MFHVDNGDHNELFTHKAGFGKPTLADLRPEYDTQGLREVASRVVKQRDLGIRFSELKSQFHYFLAVGPWTSYFASLMSQSPLLKNGDNSSIDLVEFL